MQWLRLCPSIAGDMSSIPGVGTKIPHAKGHSQQDELVWEVGGEFMEMVALC